MLHRKGLTNMKSLVFSVGILMFGTAFAELDEPKISGWEGTAYHDGWFTYGLASPYADKTHTVKLDASNRFLLSPEYPEPIRKVVLKVKCSSAAPTRKLLVVPLVGGNEAAGTNLVRACEAVSAEDHAEYVHFAWDLADNVTSIRICLDSGSGSTWGLYEIYVFSGARNEAEDAKILELTNELPAPSGLAFADFTEDALTAAADSVAGTAGYGFALYRLDGTAEVRKMETFQNWPEMTDGWTVESSANAKLSNDPNYADGDESALRIDKKSSSSTGSVCVAIMSPQMTVPVSSCSFVCRIGAKDKSDRFAVFVRTTESAAWEAIATDLTPSTKGANKAFAFSVDPAKDIRQVRFELTGVAENFTVAGMDSLSVVSGGDVTRTLVSTVEPVASPTNLFSSLDAGRYAFRTRALASEGAEQKDSPWSEESSVIDLAWADLEMTAPQGVGMAASGEKLTVSWNPVAGADHYLVDVYPTDDPDNPVVVAQRTNGTKLTVTVKSVGEYAACVTAVSPCAKSTATSLPCVAETVLGKLGSVMVEAMDQQTIAATWKTIPLAESYQARIFRLDGAAETVKPDFSGLPGSWPEGWNHYSYDTTCYAGPVPKMMYAESWIETCEYAKPVTSVTYKFKSHVTAEEFQDEIGKTSVVLAIPGEARGAWTSLDSCPVTAAMQTITREIPADRNVRKMRFFVQYTGDNPNYATKVGLEFSITSIVCGELTREEAGLISTTADSATFGGLKSSERYQVEVLPQPSADTANASVSEVLDLASEHFRQTGPLPLSQVRGGSYREDFSSLSNVTSDVEIRKLGLDYWQFNKGAGAAEKMLYTAGTNRTTGGVYAFGDAGRQADPYRLGSLATSSMGCSFGIAFCNDGLEPVGVSALSFDMIQRSFRNAPQTYVLEWLMTDGATGIATDGDWQPLPIPATAPDTALTQDGREEVVRSVSLTDVLPTKKISAGGVLIFRWRHEKVSSGPMMAIDNVKVEFTKHDGFKVLLR